MSILYFIKEWVNKFLGLFVIKVDEEFIAILHVVTIIEFKLTYKCVIFILNFEFSISFYLSVL